MFTYKTSISSNLRSVVILGTSVSILLHLKIPPFDDGMGAEVGGVVVVIPFVSGKFVRKMSGSAIRLEVRGCKRVDYPEYYEHLL